MTLVVKLDLDIIKIYMCTKNEVPTFSSSKVIIWTDSQTARQTDIWTDRQTHIQTDRQTQLKLLPTAYADGTNVQHGCFIKRSVKFEKDYLDFFANANLVVKETFLYEVLP